MAKSASAFIKAAKNGSIRSIRAAGDKLVRRQLLPCGIPESYMHSAGITIDIPANRGKEIAVKIMKPYAAS